MVAIHVQLLHPLICTSYTAVNVVFVKEIWLGLIRRPVSNAVDHPW